jgi:acyl-CoA thioesterase-1
MKILPILKLHWIKKLRRILWRPKKFVYVAIGDSTVEGIGASHPSKSFPSLVFEQIRKDHKEAVYHNLGKGGAKVRDVIDHQLSKAIELKPDLVTISVGGNDLHRRTKFSHFKKDYQYLLKTLREKTDAEIIVSNIPDVSALPSISIFFRYFVKFLNRRLNRVISKNAKEFRCALIDLYNGGKSYRKFYKDLIASDGFHPSDRGYALWAGAIIEKLKLLY